MKKNTRLPIMQLLAVGLFCVLFALPQKSYAGAQINYKAKEVNIHDGYCEVVGYFTNSGDMAAEITKSEVTVTISDQNGNTLYTVVQSFSMYELYVWGGAPQHTFVLYDSRFKSPKAPYRWTVNTYNWWNNVRPIGM